MIRANAHAYILCRLRDPTYRSSVVDDDVDPGLAAAIMASLQDSEFDAAQIAAAIAESIEESKRTAAASSSSAAASSAAASSAAASAAVSSAEYDMHILKTMGLQVIGGVKPMSVGIASSDIRKTFKMVDVKADGNCGAYALSIVNFAANATVLSGVEVRNRLVELAEKYIALELLPSYGEATREKADGSVRYLEQQELAVFCESLNVNCVIFAQGRMQNYTAFSHVVTAEHPYAERPYAVFVNTQRGNHYELVVKMKGSDKFSLLLELSDVADLLATHAEIKSPPYTWFEKYNFFKEDFVFTDPPRRYSKKRKFEKLPKKVFRAASMFASSSSDL